MLITMEMRAEAQDKILNQMKYKLSHEEIRDCYDLLDEPFMMHRTLELSMAKCDYDKEMEYANKYGYDTSLVVPRDAPSRNILIYQTIIMPYEMCETLFDRSGMKDAGTIVLMYNVEMVLYLSYFTNVDLNDVFFIADGDFKASLAQWAGVPPRNILNAMFIPGGAPRGITRAGSTKTKLYTNKQEKQLIKRATEEACTHIIKYKNRVKYNGGNNMAVVAFNPPYGGKDLEMLLALKNANADAIAVVHPANWMLQNKDNLSALATRAREELFPMLESSEMFNGNAEFGVKLITPVAINVFKRDSTVDAPDITYLVDDSYSARSINDMTVHGSAWVKHSMIDVLNTSRECKSVVDIDEYSPELFKKLGRCDSNKIIQFASVSGHARQDNNAPRGDMYKGDFFTLTPIDQKIAVGVRSASRNAFEFSTSGEADNFLSYMNSFAARLFLSLVKTDPHIDTGQLNYVPAVDFTKHWTDVELYEYFGFSDELIEYLEEFLGDYYSRKGTSEYE